MQPNDLPHTEAVQCSWNKFPYPLESKFYTLVKENIFPLLEVELHAFIYCNYSGTVQNGILVPPRQTQIAGCTALIYVRIGVTKRVSIP